MVSHAMQVPGHLNEATTSNLTIYAAGFARMANDTARTLHDDLEKLKDM